MDRLSRRIFLTTLMASGTAPHNLEENQATTILRHASRAGLFTAGFIASLSASQMSCVPSCDLEREAVAQPIKTVPLPPESVRTFTPEEIEGLKGWDINQASRYPQEFTVDEITWLLRGGIPPERSQDFLKSENRITAIKEEIKKQYDDRFDADAKNILIGKIYPQDANSYPDILSAQTIVDLWKEKPRITPGELRWSWNDEDLGHFVATNTPIRKTLGYSKRWKAKDVAELVRYAVPSNGADAYPEALDGLEVGILWQNRVDADLAKRALARFSKEALLELAKSGETMEEGLNNIEEALKFPCKVDEKTGKVTSCRFSAGYILRILKQGYSGEYVAKYDEKFPEHSVAFFVENGITAEEANANFPKRIGPSRFLAIRKKHKDFPPHVIDAYPEHYNAKDRYDAAMAGMGVGYADAYSENLSGEEAVLLWKNRIFGEEASTYADWLDAEQILLLKRRGITGPQTQKYLEYYPLEDIIAKERRKSR